MQHDTGYQRDEKAQAHEAAESAKETASQVGGQIKQEAQAQAENIRSQAASMADEHRSEAADTVAAVAAALGLSEVGRVQPAVRVRYELQEIGANSLEQSLKEKGIL